MNKYNTHRKERIPLPMGLKIFMVIKINQLGSTQAAYLFSRRGAKTQSVRCALQDIFW